VHAIGIHIIGKAAAAADARYDNDIFARYPELGHHFLHLRQDGIVTTSGTPADFLIRGEILCGKRSGRWSGGNHLNLKIAASYDMSGDRAEQDLHHHHKLQK